MISRPRTRAPALLAGAAATFALGGCGTPPLSVTQLRSTATKVCQLAVKQGNRIPGPASPAAGASFLRGGVVVLKYELANLRGLRPPGSMATTYKNALADFSAELTLIQGTLPRLDSGGDPVIAIKLLQEQLAPIESRGSLAWQALGIPACVNQ